MHKTSTLKPCATCHGKSKVARWRSIPSWEMEGYVCGPCERDLTKRDVAIVATEFDWS